MPLLDSARELVARTELADLIAEATGGLSDRDRAVFELSYRHGLEGAELAAALEVSVARARAMAYWLRRTIELSLGALLVARRARQDPDACHELADVLNGWDGDFTGAARKRITRHVESCPTCDTERRRLVTPAALLGATPLFIAAPDWLREQTLGRVRFITASSGRTACPCGEAPPPPHLTRTDVDSAVADRRARRALTYFAVLTATLLTAMGSYLARRRRRPSRFGDRKSVMKPRPPASYL